MSRVALGCALALGIPLHAAFAEWQSVPAIRLGMEGNDNPRLGQWIPGPGGGAAPPEDHTATRTLLDARIEFANTGQRGNFSIEPRATFDAYADEVDDDLERQDAYLTARGAYRWQRATGNLRASLSRESILTSELVDTDFTDPDDDFIVEEPIETDTGRLVLLDEYRKRLSLAPSIAFSLSDRNSLSLAPSIVDVSYTGVQFAGRTDFTDTGITLGLNRATSDRAEAALRLLVSKYEAEATRNDTDTTGLEGYYAIELTEVMSLDFAAGVERSDFVFVNGAGISVSDTETNVTFNVGLTMRSDVGTLNLDVGRTVGPSGSGFLSQRNEVRAFYRRRMSDKLRGGIGLALSDTESLDGLSDQRDFARLDLDLEWALTALWSLSLGYSNIDQDFGSPLRQQEGGKAQVVSLGAVYRGLRRR
jgi:hypothetical protein